MSSSTIITCGKRYEGSQMVCDRCGFTWDMNDPDPPICRDENEDNSPRPQSTQESLIAPKGDHDEEMRKIRENLES